jgi:hypothetical protein
MALRLGDPAPDFTAETTIAGWTAHTPSLRVVPQPGR